MKVEQVAVQKVEVGDIWEDNESVIYVYDVDDESISVIGKVKDIDYFGCFDRLIGSVDFYEFTKTYKYVGKAKGNIKDLFEARDDI